MDARHRPWRAALAGLVAAAMAVTTTTGCGSDREDRHDAPLATVDGEVTGEITVDERADVAVPAASIAGVEAITPVLDVATSGEVGGEVEIRTPLTRTVPSSGDVVVFALTAESPEGPWEVVPAEVEGGDVVITTSHFSLFQAFRALVGSVGDVARTTWDGLTSGVFAEATPPRCDDEAGARAQGYEIGSDNGDTVFWCLGVSEHGRYLRVVNNRRYALLLSYSRGMTVIEQERLGVDVFTRLTRALALDHQVAVAPRGQVTFRVNVAPGQNARVTSQFDGVGSSLAQLQMGFEALVTILNRFGAGPKAGSSDAERRLLTVLDKAACVDALGSDNAGTLVAKCFGLDELRDMFGVGAAVILAPVVTAGSLVSYFQSQLNALGDQFNGRDAYTITIGRRAVEAPEPVEAEPALVEMRGDQVGPLVIGMTLDEAQSTGWVGEERTSCQAALGIDPEGRERMFMLTGPEAPAGLDAYAVFYDGALTEVDVHGGARAAGVIDLPSRLTLQEAAAQLEEAGYTTEISSLFDTEDYLRATDADGQTLAMMGSGAGIPQITTCD